MNNAEGHPLYYHLKQTILKWIEDENYPPGALLPSEKQMQEMFNLSRTTVRNALKELEVDGVIVRCPGRGTFVASTKMESGPRRLLSFTQEMTADNRKPSSQIISLKKGFPAIKIAKLLKLEPNQTIWQLERIRFADSIPVATETNYLPAHIVKDLDLEQLKSGSLYTYLETEFNLFITMGKERLEARLANSREAKHLDLPKGSPILYVERLTYAYERDKSSVTLPVELVRTTYNANKYLFNYILERSL